MNRFLRSHLIVGCLLLASVSLQGCYGQFALTRKLYQWNGTLGDKWINSIMMVAMAIIPVYGITILADGLVINAMEFWSGKNPVTMSPEERETRVVSIQGREFIVTATRNRLDIVPAQGAVETAGVVYAPEQREWFVEFRGERRKIADQDGETLTLLYPDGRKEIVSR